MIIKILIFNLFYMIVACYGYSQNKFSDTLNNFNKEIVKFISDSELQNSSISFYAIDLKTNQIIGEINPDLLLSPASTMKLFTTTTALETFGPEYTFSTKIGFNGFIKNSVLYGNIIIKGEGDPCLMSNNFKSNYLNVFKNIVEECKKIGINKVQGKIIGDASFYTDNFAPSTWILADVANYYGASPWALSIFDNEYKLFFNTGEKAGDSTFITKKEPEISLINLNNIVKSDNVSGDQSIIYGGLFDNYRVATGKLPLHKSDFEVKGSIPNPPIYAALLLKQELNKNGIIVTDSVQSIYEYSINTDSLQTPNFFYTIKSPLLKDIIYYTNIKSVNLYAEHLLRQLGIKFFNNGSNEYGINAVTKYWQNKCGKFLMFDGSGLSRFNAVSSKQLVEVLKYMKNESKNFSYFYNSLPIASRSGSLTTMFKGTFAENNLHAKSGYMTGVRSYAGYIKSKSSKEIAFAIILNNYISSPSVIKGKIEELLVKLSEI
ncbi:MAG: D-alanyl-D-alanine carboxypeptidase/D-alanyl-D-alanine-endopeptidase [Bacteroidetes bacterium CG_4_8_14_3_um_filter_31_14]|nr:MAG: D-alanyl-D-alanine carboxypeptidase/D-alanyl-D-alanine-endopeptidase [Bacteroidetes bacterium CG_4_8_14_3_um_filter_31_14]